MSEQRDPPPKRVRRPPPARAKATAPLPVTPDSPELPPLVLSSHDAIDAPEPVQFWQRWPLMAQALGNAFLFLLYALGVPFRYIVVQTAPPSVWTLIARLAFWGALSAATAATVCLTLGLWRSHYHALLHTVLFCTMLPYTLVWLMDVLLTLQLRAGYSEPTILLLLLIAQTAVIQSAHRVEPSRLVYSLAWPASLRRWGRGVQAFRRAIGEPPERDDGS